MTSWFHVVCAVLAATALIIAVVPSLPIMSNADDHQRYYIGGYVGAARYGLAPPITTDLGATLHVLSGRDRRYFLLALSPYSPVWIPQAALLDAVRRYAAPGIEVRNWAVFSSTVAGLLWMAGLFWVMRRGFPGNTLAWAFTVLSVTAFLHQNTRPFDLAPRSLSTFATALAVGLVLSRKRPDALAFGLLALGAAFHSYQQVANVAVATMVLLLVQPRRVLDTMLPALAFVAVSFAITFGASPVPIQTPSSVLDGSVGGGFTQNWDKNHTAVIQVTRYLAPLTGVLVWQLSDIRRGIVAGLAVAATVAVTGVLTDPGLYLGEYPNRVGGAWNGAILALLLQKDWIAAAAVAPASRRRWAMTGCVLVLLIVVARMDARYRFVHRLENFQARIANGLDYQPGPSEALGLALIPR
jgi:hypothetical protein